MIFRVHYMKPDWFRNGICGMKPVVAELGVTHIYLRDVTVKRPNNTEDALENVFYQSQGEYWSPNGEARGLIQSKGLGHTSMSVGDVIEHEGRFWVAATFGFEELAA